MDLAQVLALQGGDATVIDARDAASFAAGHLRGSINVGLEGRFAEYVGTVVTPDTPLVLVTEPGVETEAKVRLGRIGFDEVVGALEGGAAAFIDRPDEIVPASRLTATQLADRRAPGQPTVQLIDIRNPGEVRLGSIPGASPIPLAELRGRVGELDLDDPIVVFCAGGYRSSIAASLLRSLGAADVSDLLGGYGGWVAAAPTGR